MFLVITKFIHKTPTHKKFNGEHLMTSAQPHLKNVQTTSIFIILLRDK